MRRVIKTFVYPEQMHLFGKDFVEVIKAEVKSRRNTYRQISEVRGHLRNRVWACDIVIEMLEKGILLPDIEATMGLRPSVPRVSKPDPKIFRLRTGTDAEAVYDLLYANNRKGLTESALVDLLKAQGRLANAEHPRRAVHWCLTNLAKRSGGAVLKLGDGRWYVIRPVLRTDRAKA